MKPMIDIVSDLGEGFGAYTMANDNEMLELISSANIACGFHAGDPRTMANVVEKSVQLEVGIGAHPGFPDVLGFGRRRMDLSPWEIYTDVLYQLGAISAFTNSFKVKLEHMSLHGELAHFVETDKELAEAVVEAVLKFDDSLIILAEKGLLTEVAKGKNLKTANIIYADRAYGADGKIVSRKHPNAVIHDSEAVIERCLKMVIDNKVKTVEGDYIDIDGDSLLLHGDTDGALQLAQKINESLISEGVEIKRLNELPL